MSRILFSWLDPMADFHHKSEASDRAPLVRDDSPNYQLHAHHYQPQSYDAHWLLYSEPEDTRQKHALAFQKRIEREFSRNQLVVCHLGLRSIGDLSEVRDKVAALLQERHRHGATHLDVFFATGTAAMVLAWYICHETLQLPTRLVSFTPPNFGYYQDRPPLMEVRVDQSPVPLAATIRQRVVDLPPAGANRGPILTGATRVVYGQASDLAAANCRVIIYGETGTGKEMLARHLHHESPRRDRAFLTINCGGMAENILESELFGHAKGAFTGADREKAGLFEAANGGSLLLDEIGDISPKMQVALLRVLQEGRVRRLGETEERPVDVWVMAATHRDLLAEAVKGRFRWDLYYRLAIGELELPPVRNYSPADRQALLDGLLADAAPTYKRAPLVLAPDAQAYLTDYPFYGNIREMKGLVESLYVLAARATTVDLSTLRTLGICTRLERRRAALLPSEEGLAPLQVANREVIAEALRQAKTLTEAANKLEMGSVNTLRAKMKELGLHKEEFPNIRWRT
jgi:transcriptional regulator with AAA-type ATPase domain